jgi:hypothetical protein
MTKFYSIPDSYRSTYTQIPKRLLTYIEKLLEKQIEGSSFHTAVKDHSEATFRSLNAQFSQASEITQLPPDELLSKLDFNIRDLCPSRIESLLGELRTIIFLDAEGFENIKPLQANRSKKSPDLSAEKHGKPCLVEVATSIRYASRTFHDSVVKWAKSRLEKDGKINQVGKNKNLFLAILTGRTSLEGNDNCIFPKMH